MADRIPVEPLDPSKENSPIAGPVEDEGTVILNAASKFCLWNGEQYEEGKIVVSEGVAYECSLGQWVKTD